MIRKAANQSTSATNLVGQSGSVPPCTPLFGWCGARGSIFSTENNLKVILAGIDLMLSAQLFSAKEGSGLRHEAATIVNVATARCAIQST